jgi:hypothetical protein
MVAGVKLCGKGVLAKVLSREPLVLILGNEEYCCKFIGGRADRLFTRRHGGDGEEGVDGEQTRGCSRSISAASRTNIMSVWKSSSIW